MDYGQLKDSIKEISEIAASVPEQFRNKCFELLLANLLRQNGDAATGGGKSGKEEHKSPDDSEKKPKGDGVPITTQLRVLMKKTDVTKDEIDKILLYDNGEVHFIKEPHAKGITTGQIEWTLLLALKNAIEKNSLATDPEEVRSVCQDKGYYDKGNFSKVFKRNAKLFRKTLTAQGPAEPLSSEGQDALGVLIKRLATEAEK